MATLEQRLLAHNHGNRVAAIFDLTASCMRGDPEELKAGWSAEIALASAIKLFKPGEGERREIVAALLFGLSDNPVIGGMPTSEIIHRTEVALTYLCDGAREGGLQRLREIVEAHPLEPPARSSEDA